MVNAENITDAVFSELAMSYTQAGRVAPSTLPEVSRALEDALHFSSVKEVRETFRRARDMADIPTQRVLKEALSNHRAESYNEVSGETPAIEYRDPREAWLPKSIILKQINLNTAMANYCIACGGNSYANLCSARVRGKEAYEAFTRGIKDTLRNLYTKYWRKCPIANGYPFNAKLNLGLIPPSVDDFRRMFAMENAGHV